MFTTHAILLAALGGIGPAIIWLLFWLQEDEHPNPRRVILTTFFFGMLCVPLVLPFQFLASKLLIHSKEISDVAKTDLFLAGIIAFLWAGSEELLKYLASHIAAFQRETIKEPMDWVIYMISTALGFAGLENTLFLINPLIEGDITKSFATGDLRFIGATLLHVICSAVIGSFLAFAFYKPRHIKIIYGTLGIFTAIALHTMFNLFIIVNEHSTLTVFGFVWVAIIILFLLLEKIKRLQPNTLQVDIN